mmetsp:Transcript_14597/g.29379  ORF Transcript_14597/g.29379 Transcript_14597/m.29379 type:complete len:292 (-) Transcript_14597:846-1721(-)
MLGHGAVACGTKAGLSGAQSHLQLLFQGNGREHPVVFVLIPGEVHHDQTTLALHSQKLVSPVQQPNAGVRVLRDLQECVHPHKHSVEELQVLVLQALVAGELPLSPRVLVGESVAGPREINSVWVSKFRPGSIHPRCSSPRVHVRLHHRLFAQDFAVVRVGPGDGVCPSDHCPPHGQGGDFESVDECHAVSDRHVGVEHTHVVCLVETENALGNRVVTFVSDSHRAVQFVQLLPVHVPRVLCNRVPREGERGLHTAPLAHPLRMGKVLHHFTAPPGDAARSGVHEIPVSVV